MIKQNPTQQFKQPPKQQLKQATKQQPKQLPIQWPRPLAHVFPSSPLQKLKWMTTMTTTYTIFRDEELVAKATRRLKRFLRHSMMFTRKPVVWCEKAICFIRLQPSDRLTRENLELSSAITFFTHFFQG